MPEVGGAGSDSLSSTRAVLPPLRDTAGPPKCDMERGAVTFDDVAVYFTEEEWRRLQEDERNLYKEVMSDNYQMILSLNRPDLITNIELGCEPYITTAWGGDIPDSWHGDSSVCEEDPQSTPPLKRYRRYPRVNPLRWVKRHKRSKIHPARTSQRSEHRDHVTEEEQSAEGRSGPHTEGCSIPARIGEEEVEPSRLHTGRRWATSRGDVTYRPDLRVTLNISQGEEPEGAWGKGQGSSDWGHESQRAAPPPDHTDIPTNPPPAPTKTTDDLPGAEGPVHPDCVCNEMTVASPCRREKHVQFSDTVTTFIFGAEDAESGCELRSKCRPCPGHVTSTRVLRTRGEESTPQDCKSNTTPPKGRTTRLRGTLGAEGLKTPHSMEFIKKTEEAEEPPPCDPTEPPPFTGPHLQPEKKDVGTQIDLIHKEEELPAEVQLTPPPPPAATGQNFVKSYSCSNCGKITHWTKLNEQQKAVVIKPSYLHICTMCRRQREKNNAVLSPPSDNHAQNTAATKCTRSRRANVARGPATKTPHGSPPGDSSIEGPTTKKKHRVNGVAETQRSPANQNVQPQKGEESPGTSTNYNVHLNKGEGSPMTVTNHNVLLEKGEVSPRRLTNHSIQQKKGEESPKTSTNHNVHLQKGEESPRASTNCNVRVKEGEGETSVTAANQNALLKITDPNKTRSSSQDVHTDLDPNLCSQCRACGAAGGAELHHKVKSIKGTTKRATNVPSGPDLKSSTPERRKGHKALQNGASDEEKLSSTSRSIRGPISPNNQKNGVAGKQDMCIKCGKRLLEGQNLKPLTSIQHKRPLRGGSSIITEKVQSTKSDAAPKERVRKSPAGPKEKKPPNTEGQKRPARGARDRVLCTKCGKRLVLHVAPGQDGPSEGGSNENECVVLPRKKRKRPLDGMEPFICKECGKIFTRHFTLLQHRLIHTGERPYACKVCAKSFRDSSYLIVHMRSHTKEKPYSCTQCGKCFSQNSALHVHLRTHSDERPFCCQDCGKSFTDRSTYRHHLRIHTGEKPYACSFCGKKFTQQPHMKRHETIHTGERPFECAQCGKRFIEKTKLKKHELVHQKGKD